jgi:hypothetical protein
VPDYPRPKTPPPVPGREVRTAKEPPPAVAAQLATPEPIYEVDDLTGQHQAGLITKEQLRERRGTRTPGERMDKLEDRVDELHGDVREIKGSLSVLPQLASNVAALSSHMLERDHVTFTAQVDVDTAKKTADIEKAAAIAVAEKKDEIKDRASRRESRRKLVNKWLGLAGGVVVVAAIHKLLQLWVPWL